VLRGIEHGFWGEKGNCDWEGVIQNTRSAYPHIDDVLALTLDRVLDLYQRLTRQSRDAAKGLDPDEFVQRFENGEIDFDPAEIEELKARNKAANAK
jgi:hypothetical protein